MTIKPTPPRLDVHLPKYRAEAEAKRKLDSVAFMASLKTSKWLK